MSVLNRLLILSSWGNGKLKIENSKIHLENNCHLDQTTEDYVGSGEISSLKKNEEKKSSETMSPSQYCKACLDRTTDDFVIQLENTVYINLILNNNILNMLRPWWFQEYSPGQQIIFDQVKELIEKNYQSFGYTHIHTPAVENNSVLTAKWGDEASKQIFGLYWLAQWTDDAKKYSLHFDLTVPFARYVLDWAGEVSFPFKRSQIQPVWRWERQQKGRYKEFWQADIDVIWEEWRGNDKIDSSKYMYYDAEVIYTLGNTIKNILNYLKVDGKIVIKVNNRKLTWWLMSTLFPNDSDMSAKIFELLDKYYKMPEKTFYSNLRELIENDDDYVIIKPFLKSSLEELEEKEELWEIYNEGVREIKSIIETIKQLDIDDMVDVEYDPFIVRGLDYYTGTVFETFWAEKLDWGSVCSGWRYDNLTKSLSSGKVNYSWVGGSIWLSRIVSLIIENWMIETNQKTISEYMFLNFDSSKKEILKLAQNFRKDGKNIEIFPYEAKFGKQMKYAEKKGIKYVVILWENELEKWEYQIKNLETGDVEIINVKL